MEKKLLEKFKRGKCSSEELRKILKWLQSDEAEFMLSEEIEKYWGNENHAEGNSFKDKEKLYKEILALIDQRYKMDLSGKEIVDTKDSKRSLYHNIFYNYRKLAAIILIVIISGCAIMIWRVNSNFPKNSSHKNNIVAFVEKVSPKGQKVTLQLPDGTLVKLNSRSKIKYSTSFTGDTRTVWFEGEGFFNVAHNKDKPFIIISGGTRTTVVGTSFNIKAFPEDSACEIVVVTGKVKFDNLASKGGVLLNPNQGAVYYKQSESIIKKDSVNLANILAWKEGIIAFANADLEEIIRELENWYGVDFKVNSTKGIISGYTGTYQNKSLESVLEGIGYVMNFRFEIKGKDVIIN